jgi:hypothetical protein
MSRRRGSRFDTRVGWLRACANGRPVSADLHPPVCDQNQPAASLCLSLGIKRTPAAAGVLFSSVQTSRLGSRVRPGGVDERIAYLRSIPLQLEAVLAGARTEEHRVAG